MDVEKKLKITWRSIYTVNFVKQIIILKGVQKVQRPYFFLKYVH
jgi:hypothetical protein